MKQREYLTREEFERMQFLLREIAASGDAGSVIILSGRDLELVALGLTVAMRLSEHAGEAGEFAA